MVIITAMNGEVSQYAVKSGNPDEDLMLTPGFYSVSFVASDAVKLSSYPQYKWQVPEGDEIEFDAIEIQQLV